MNTAAKPYKTRGMVEVARTRANFYDIFPGGYTGRDSMGGRGSCRAAGSMRVPASRFGGSLTLPVESNLVELRHHFFVAGTSQRITALVDSSELLMPPCSGVGCSNFKIGQSGDLVMAESLNGHF